MKLGEYIKTFRENHNISMEKFADMSGLSKSYVGVLERGKNYKTGEPITPSVSIIKKVADATGVSFDALFSMIDGMVSVNSPKATQEAVKIPILGTVIAGIPISACEEILGYEEITPDMAATGEFYALKIKGNSMEPRICEGDVVIVRVQPDVECGEMAVVLVNGEDATIKNVQKNPDGITLMPNNRAYTPRFFTNRQIQELPVVISGKVVELRARF